MNKFVVAFSGVLIAASVFAAEKASLTGTWNMALQGDHVIPTALVLKQDGKSLTGTIAMPTQNIGQRVEVQLTGEVGDEGFTLSGAVEHAKEPTTVALTGRMKDDGSLEGEVVMRSERGDHRVPYTAERLKERRPSGL
jgi:hypothetical protein